MALVQAEPVLQLPGGLGLEAPPDSPALESPEPSSRRHPVPSIPLKFSLRCPTLDAFLRGGIPSRSVTELVGESTCGKTQLCLQLMLSCRMEPERSGHGASALCIYTEGRFPLKRLLGLASSAAFTSPEKSAKQLCDGIFIRELQELGHVLQFLEHDVIEILRRPPGGVPVRVLVLDSVAALFRSEYDNDSAADMQGRTEAMFHLSRLLRCLAEQFDLAVVVTNQVVELIEDRAPNVAASQMGRVLISAQRAVMPALGLAWSNCVSTRLFLSRGSELSEEEGGDKETRHGLRSMQVVFSPYLSDHSCTYKITSDGVTGVPVLPPDLKCLAWK